MSTKYRWYSSQQQLPATISHSGNSDAGTAQDTAVQIAMAERSVTRTAAQIASDLAERAAANELAKKQNDVWFNKFLKDMPELDDELSNYSV